MTDRLTLIRARHAEAGGGDADKEWLLAEVEKLQGATEHLLYQFSYGNGKGELHTGSLSALEEGFDVLGWDDPHPAPHGMLCDEPGCLELSTCGFPVPGGAYRRTCGEHYRLAHAEVRP